MHIVHICAVICSFISLLLLLISLGSDYWESSTNSHAGLWRNCYNSNCSTLGQGVTGAVHAVRTFMMFGMIAGAVSFFGLCATFFQTHLGSVSLTRSSAIASFVAGLFVMIAMSIYTGTSLKNTGYGWSFGLGWAAFPLFLITGFLAYILKDGTSA